MKVALGLHAGNAHIGGAWTFESEILNAFEMLDDFGHEIVAFTDSSYPWDSSRRMKHISYHRNLSPIAKMYGSLERKLQGFLKLGTGRPSRSVLNRTLQANGIELLWMLSPDYSGVPTIPFGLTVLDLQHRKQPYFPEVSTRRDGLEWSRRESLYSEMIGRAAVLVSGTQAGASEIERFYCVEKSRIKIVPYPTPEWMLSVDIIEKAPSGLNVPKEFIYIPAGFNPHKNHVGVLYAIRQLREKHGINPAVVISGHDYGNRNYVARIAKQLGLTTLFHPVGFVSRQEAKYLYKMARIVVFPSLFGPDNLPPLEAMAVGTPVICHSWDGASEQLGDAALIVDTTDETELATAIYSAWQDDEVRERLRIRGLSRSRLWRPNDYCRCLIGIFNDFSKVRRCWG